MRAEAKPVGDGGTWVTEFDGVAFFKGSEAEAQRIAREFNAVGFVKLDQEHTLELPDNVGSLLYPEDDEFSCNDCGAVGVPCRSCSGQTAAEACEDEDDENEPGR